VTQTLDTRSLNMLVARLVEEHDRRAEHIIDGSASTFEDYRERVGFLRGLAFAKDQCDHVERELYGNADRKKS
jgi:hypothetical protein